MSTAFEWRESAMARRREAEFDEPREQTRVRSTAPSAPVALERPAAATKGGSAVSRAVAARLRQRLGRARFVALTIVALSILGLIYLTQISHVARYGYLLSDLQRQQVRTERENQLLEYQLSSAHNLNEVNSLASRTYGMQPLLQLTPVGPNSVPSTAAGGTTARSGAQGTPQARYITVRRPAASTLPPAPAVEPETLFDLLGRHLIGIGVASAEK